MKKKTFIALSLFIIYFIFSLLTLKDYNISWDEPIHFKRGQAYFWYFLTGNKDYNGLPSYKLDEARKNPGYHERSFYQDNNQNFPFWIKIDGGHPPLNGILASFSNYIFYQKLGWLGDVESYHLFEIFISSILISVVFLFAAVTFGIWPGLYAAIFTGFYPLFWSESHFNIKDPIETTFFTITIYFFWYWIKKKNVKYLLFSALSAGLAFSTKFNILFSPFIFGAWILVRQFILKIDSIKLFFSKKTLFLLFFFPVIMLAILVFTWPFLWHNTLNNFLSVFHYYQEMGTEESFKTHFLFGQWSTYAIKWIIYSTPPILLLSLLIGVFSLFSWTKEKKDVLLLWILWLGLTIIRVSLPNTSIYGGIRQIMEFIPPMALIGAVGIFYLQNILIRLLKQKLIFNQQVVGILFTVITLFFTVRIIWNYHPNENVYFNFLSGGLKNQVEKGLPAAGNSFGNAYLPALVWLNQNAGSNSKVAMVQALNWNIPTFKFRPDILFSNYYWSGINKEGEYLLDLTYNYNVKVYLYAWEYLEKMMTPVYEYKVDGVPIVTIWKNDLAHTKLEYQKQEKPYQGEVKTKVDGQTLLITLSEKTMLSRLILEYHPTEDCLPIKEGIIRTSLDGKNWRQEGDPLSLDQLGRKYQIDKSSLRYMFAAREAKYIEIEIDNSNSCVLQDSQVKITMLE